MDLAIHFERRLVGTIAIRDQSPCFQYSPEWLATRGCFPISLTMPLQSAPYPSSVILPWAANLLPESEQLRAVGTYLHTSVNDVIGILRAMGRDTAGALSMGEPATPAKEEWRPVAQESDLERIINELPNKPFLVGSDGISMSLAGGQSKIGVALNEQRQICIPMNGAPSTHILKPDNDVLWGGVQNEAFCLSLARRIGLQVPEVTTGRAGKRAYLLIARYDRRFDGQRWRRLHQEDFCQATGRLPINKYETPVNGIKGATLRDMFAVVQRHAGPNDTLRLLDNVIANVLCCNTDAHAKNYALLIGANGASMAPAYDIMCAAVWENITKNMAMKIADKTRGEHLKARHWTRFAKECGLNGPRVLARVEHLANKARQEAANAADDVAQMPAGPHPLLKPAQLAIETRARALLSGLKDLEPEPAPENSVDTADNAHVGKPSAF